MEIVVGLIVVVALATVLKLGIRRVFRGPGYAQREAQARAEAKPKPSPKPTSRPRPPTGRTTPKGTRRR